MKITADTNLLMRALTGDDAKQSLLAQSELAAAELVAIPLAASCELIWVLSHAYKIEMRAIGEAVRRLIGGGDVVVDRPAVEAGLAMLDDFADGVIAHEGRGLGAAIFVSFDKAAMKRI